MFKTHRCHKKEFLLKFAQDRECWLGWLFEAKKRWQHRQRLNEKLAINNSARDKAWTESLAVGREAFVEKVPTLLGAKATNRKVAAIGDKHALREQSARYNIVSGDENIGLSLDNRLLLDGL
jgi:hypothetical protein